MENADPTSHASYQFTLDVKIGTKDLVYCYILFAYIVAIIGLPPHNLWDTGNLEEHYEQIR